MKQRKPKKVGGVKSHKNRFCTTKYIKYNGPLCMYCGDTATSEEHFPPVSVGAARGIILPACLECNVLAHDDHPFKIKERVKCVRDRLQYKYRRLLNMPKWTTLELEQLEGSLKLSVMGGIQHKRKITARLSWDWKAYLYLIGIGWNKQGD